MASLLATLFAWELWIRMRGLGAAPLRRFGHLVAAYMMAVLLFAVVAGPSWIPRWHYHGNPFFHGHLENFMWADSYEAAREKPASSLREYVATHSIPEMLQRWRTGFFYICGEVPFRLGRVLHGFALIGFVVAVARRNRTYLFLALFSFIQLQPIIWTSVVNGSRRVAYPGIICFDWFFAALAFAWIIEIASRSMRGRGVPAARLRNTPSDSAPRPVR